MELVTVLVAERETKNTVRYVESDVGPLRNGEKPGTLYVPKAALPDPYPEMIEVVIKSLDD